MPARAHDHVTTDELLAVTRSGRDTLYRWVAERLLPRPRIASGPDGKPRAVWSDDALERVRFIVELERAGLEPADIAARVAARWPRR